MSFDPGAGLQASTLALKDGRTLRYVHAGEGDPLVVFEAGMGECASQWITVQRLVSQQARTVSYDRAGHTESTPDSMPRTLQRMSEDLGALLDQVSPDAPVVLVAHSWGGPVVRCYAEKHPGRVAGVVLVDSSVTAAFPTPMAKATPVIMSFALLMHRVGLGKALHSLTFRVRSHDELPAADLAVLERDLRSICTARTSVAEARALPSSLQDMARWESKGLPLVPVVNLVAGGRSGRQEKQRVRVLASQEQEMARHPLGHFRVAAQTGHFVPQERPVLTAAAILQVVNDVAEHRGGVR